MSWGSILEAAFPTPPFNSSSFTIQPKGSEACRGKKRNQQPTQSIIIHKVAINVVNRKVPEKTSAGIS